MTQTTVSGWMLESERGPGGWLFVRLHPPQQDGGDFPLADAVWDMLQQCFANKVVLEMDEVSRLDSSLIGQLVRLYKRVGAHQGLLRLSNLSHLNQQSLQISRLGTMFPMYSDRQQAVMGGFRPPQPR